jgi:hypothetical protein
MMKLTLKFVYLLVPTEIFIRFQNALFFAEFFLIFINEEIVVASKGWLIILCHF